MRASIAMRATGAACLLVTGIISATACGAGDSTSSAESTPPAAVSTTTAAINPTAPRIADLQSRWWSWAASEPSPTNPVADLTGEDCARGQSTDVWFVAGTFGTEATRECTVPAGRAIAGPLLNWTTNDPAKCTSLLAAARGEVTLDGRRIDTETINEDRVVITGVADNPVTRTSQERVLRGCGLWFTLAPLSAGKHTLAIHGTNGDFAVDVVYALNVE